MMCFRVVTSAGVLSLLVASTAAEAERAPTGKMPKTEIALDVSITCWARFGPEDLNRPEKREAWQQQTWGQRGLETVMDTALAAGVRQIHFRVHAPGPYWPTKVKDAAPCYIPETFGLKPTFKEWNVVRAAAEAAHRKGIKILGWFDLTEGHAGHPTKWALKHPQFCVVGRNGVRRDGRSKEPEKWPGYNDPVISFAYPEVVEYRLALLDELLSFGVDGVFLVVNQCVGYEPPVRESFKGKYGVEAMEIAEDDPRWIEHQRGYFTAFVRKVHELFRHHERTAGRELEFVLEGQGGTPGPDHPPEPGWPNIPRWAMMNPCVDVETIAREKLVDGLCFWQLREIDRLSPEVRRNVKTLTRYRCMGWGEREFKTRLTEAEKRGVSVLIINESRVALAGFRWMYPGEPGPLYKLSRELSPR